MTNRSSNQRCVPNYEMSFKRHSRESGKPGSSAELDSRFRGNDTLERN